jgi:hypothetical protein
MHTNPIALVTLSDVTVMRALDDALMCRIEQHVRWIPKAQLRDGSTIRQTGDVGVLVVPWPFAAEWGLTPYDS